MSETTLTLIRHGQTDWNLQRRLQGRSDIPLNDTGREQARAVGRELAASGGHWDVLVSSPLQRARETAQVIGREIGLELSRTYEDLVERAFGDGEATEDVVQRGLSVLRTILADFPGKDVMVVAHGTLIRLTLDRVLDTELPSLDNGQVLTVTAEQVLSAD